MPKKTTTPEAIEILAVELLDPFADPVVGVLMDVARYMDLHQTEHRGVIMFALAITWADPQWTDIMRTVVQDVGGDTTKATAAFVAKVQQSESIKDIVGSVQRRGAKVM